MRPIKGSSVVWFKVVRKHARIKGSLKRCFEDLDAHRGVAQCQYHIP